MLRRSDESNSAEVALIYSPFFDASCSNFGMNPSLHQPVSSCMLVLFLWLGLRSETSLHQYPPTNPRNLRRPLHIDRPPAYSAASLPTSAMNTVESRVTTVLFMN